MKLEANNIKPTSNTTICTTATQLQPTIHTDTDTMSKTEYNNNKTNDNRTKTDDDKRIAKQARETKRQHKQAREREREQASKAPQQLQTNEIRNERAGDLQKKGERESTASM